MKSSATVAFFAFLTLAAAFDAVAWDELGPLKKVRREHPEYFEKGAVHEVEVDGESYWLFTGDGTRERKLFGGDSEAYREAALDARRNLVRHLTGNAPSGQAEVSGIVTAYRISEGSVRRVVCLVPKENVVIVSPAPKATPAEPQSEASGPAAPPANAAAPAVQQPAPAVPSDKAAETAAQQPAPMAPSDATNAKPPAGPPRFQMPDLPTPVLPGDNTP